MDVFTSALELAAAIKKKDLSPVEVVDAYLNQIQSLNPDLNALIWLRNDKLRQEAKVAEAAIMQGRELPAFHGVPIPIKDLTEVKGEPHTLGSKAALDKVGKIDSATVTKIRNAGFLFMGRTNSPELGTLPVTENKAYGASKNPWDLSLTPGGSSGGAAAAVASGMAPIAHASDGGGSIRIPAACCGLVGLKASRGRVAKGPVVSDILHGFSTDGCVSRTVADTAAFLDVLAKYDPHAWYNAPKFEGSYLAQVDKKPKPLRIAFSTSGPIKAQAQKICLEAVEKTAKLLAEMGHEVFEQTPHWNDADGEQLAKDFFSIWYTGTAYADISDWSKLEPHNAGLREKGFAQNSIEYIQALIRLQVFSRKTVVSWGRDFDILISPTLAMEPPKIGWVFATNETEPTKLLWRCTEMVPFTGWVNVTGQPAISLPMHTTETGLPIGVQLVGSPFREDELIQVAKQLEDAVAWQLKRP